MIVSIPNQRQPIKKELDLDLLTFVERHATNPVRWDIVAFFGGNPNGQITAEAVAQQVSVPPTTVNRELDELVVLGLLEPKQVNGALAYCLTGYEPLRQAALRFATQMDRSSFFLSGATPPGKGAL